MHDFKVGNTYTRADVFARLGIPDPEGGPWYTGYSRHGDDYFIFCGIGTAGRTGHDYHNHFIGPDLVWYGKNGSKRGQPDIERLLSPSTTVYVFYRNNDRSPFTFAGIGRAKRIRDDSSPVEVTWCFPT
jgi:5-methylcytosine-specific restriction protein A